MKRTVLRHGLGFGIFFMAVPSIQTAHADSLSSCQMITTGGSYSLSQNVAASGTDTCFTIRASDVTLDGNGHTITTSGGYAVDVQDPDPLAPQNWTNISVSNFTSNGDVRVYGDGVNHVTFDHLTVNSIGSLGGDDVTITNNTVGEGGIGVSNSDQETWFPFRNTVSHNTIAGGSTDVKTLLEVVGGKYDPCPRLDTVITDNVVTDTRNDPPPEGTAAVRIRCATHTTFTNNTVISTGTAMGLYMRDESDDGLYTDNLFRSHGAQPALHISSGNVDKTLPSRNQFLRNVFYSDAVHATYLFGMGSGNQFTNNIFWSNGEDFLGYYGGNGGNTWDHNTFYSDGSDTWSFYFAGDLAAPIPADTFTNNIFSYASETSAIFHFDNWLKSQWAGDYNLFQNRSGTLSFGYYGTFAEWKANGGTDAHSFEADPLFTNPATGDFRLASGSPAIGAASDGSDIGASGAPDPNTPAPTGSGAAVDGGCAATHSAGSLFLLLGCVLLGLSLRKFKMGTKVEESIQFQVVAFRPI
ncbi:MAG: right-handed parallel beta-helix repeat-containing protein [Pseudomonadota bacterium]